MKIGDRVKLKGKKRIAIIEVELDRDGIAGGVRLNKKLSGYRYWNKDDLEVVK
jgi:hypothetical protein